jgi:hypothetical protein
MGLDIHAASHLRYVGTIPEGGDFDHLEKEANAHGKCLDEVYFLLFANEPAWEQHLAGTEPGLYEYTAATEHHVFRAGAYSCYNTWGEHLCRFALGVELRTVWENPERFAGQPFVELINFTDSDGRIGVRLAGKLAADFRAYADKAEEFAATLHDENFIGNYRDFTKALALAAQEGALAFC